MVRRCNRLLVLIRSLILFFWAIVFVIHAPSTLAHNQVVVVPLGSSQQIDLNNIITVAKTGGDFNRVEDAVDSIDDASPDNPYLVYIAPGEYRLRRTLQMKSFVRVVGSGSSITILNGRLISETTSGCLNGIAVVLGGGSGLSDVSIRNTGSAGETRVGVCDPDTFVSGVNLDRVRIDVRSGTSNYGVISRSGALVRNSSIVTLGRSGGNESIGVLSTVVSSDVLLDNTTVSSGEGADGSGSAYAVKLDDSIEPSITILVELNNSEINGPVDVGNGAQMLARNTRFSDLSTGVGSKICLFSSIDSFAGLYSSTVLNQDCSLPAP